MGQGFTQLSLDLRNRQTGLLRDAGMLVREYCEFGLNCGEDTKSYYFEKGKQSLVRARTS